MLYKPTLVGEYTYNVQCQIEKLKKPVKLIVTAQVIEMLPKVIYIDTDGQQIEMDKNCDNIIEIEHVNHFLNGGLITID